jgi:uncharacterized coiled-coil protein SlyX
MTTPDPLAIRLQRLEESQGFADRTVEQLSAEIAMLNRHLAEVQTRMKRLEARLDQMQEPQGGDDSPDDTSE